MVNSRAKGKRGELEARDQVRTHWLARDCIRAGQACGSFSADILHALPESHVEVKLYARITAFDFMDQAVRDKKNGETPIVLMRQNGTPYWLVMLRIEDTPAFAAKLSKQLESKEPNAP